MPRTKGIEKLVPSIFRRNALDHLMFGYVQGVRKAIPSTQIMEAIQLFMCDYDLSEDDYSSYSAMTTFCRMQKDFFNK